MPIAEAIALAALAAATVADSENPRETYWVVVFASAPENYSVRETKGQPPLFSTPATQLVHQDVLTLQLTGPPKLELYDFEMPIMRWYYKRYLPDYLAALARYRRQRPPWQLKEQLGSRIREVSDEDLLIEPDWVGLIARRQGDSATTLRILGVGAGGQLAWALEQDVAPIPLDKKQRMSLMLGRLAWDVLIADRWDRSRAHWVRVLHVADAEQAIHSAMSTIDGEEDGEVEAVAVLLGAERVVSEGR
jgi:hypothetical protein